MGIFSGNSTCPLPKDEAGLELSAEPIVGSLTFQHLITIIAFACAVTAGLIDYFLIIKHLRRYTEPKQQRQIIRIIYTPSAFAVLSACSILDYDVAEYLIPLRDLYETFALAALFLLFTEFVAPDPATRDMFFSTLENHKARGSRFSFKNKGYDIVPGGSLKWFKSKWVAVFGYVIIQIITTIAQEATQGANIYCEYSLSPKFAHIWITVIQSIAVAIAVTGILTFYNRLKSEPEFSCHKPLLKLVSLKLIVSINFFQTTILSILNGENLLKGSRKVTGKDLTYGIPALLVAFEQVFFAIFFHYAFRSREYHESEKVGAKRMGIFRAAAHAFNPTDILLGMVQVFGLVGSGVGPRGDGGWKKKSAQPTSYGQAFQQNDTHLEPLSGQQRGRQNQAYEGQQYQYAQPSLSVSPPTDRGNYLSNLANRPPPGYDNLAAQDETPMLNSSYSRTHSREPSADGARSTRNMV